MTDFERYEEIKKQLDALYNACSREFAEFAKPEGFDLYTRKNQKKFKALTQKYAKYISPLQDELNEIADRLNIKIEEDQENQFISVSEAEKLKNKNKK